MVKVWSSGSGADATCKSCGATYKVTIHRFPMRDNDYFDCEICGTRMASWNDTAAPFYELISRGPIKSGENENG